MTKTVTPVEERGYSDFYRKEGERIVCELCRHYCKLKEGQVGICGVNMNDGGRLKTLVYGKVSALNIDPIEKKPLYHFLPGTTALSLGTVGCNFKCPFCQNWQISQSKEIEAGYEVTPEQLVALALEKGCKSIAYTYNEPTIFYPFARDVALLAKEHGIKNVFVSNGLETPEVIEDMQGVIDGFNIDIKGFNPEYYKKTLKGSLEGVLDTLKRLKEGGFWVECTTLIVPGDNDSDEELGKIAHFIADELDPYTPWHISAFHPDYKLQDKGPTPLQTLQRAERIGREAGLAYIYMGNVPTDGITHCPGCGLELIVRHGYHVVKNVLENGHCPACHRAIEGVWA
ncbi:AmmeMemoRadiSam system radical SAM enzyme [Nitratifractor sp.]